jgi:hypothetical protein
VRTSCCFPAGQAGIVTVELLEEAFLHDDHGDRIIVNDIKTLFTAFQPDLCARQEFMIPESEKLGNTFPLMLTVINPFIFSQASTAMRQSVCG